MSSRPIRLLTFTSLFPNQAMPRHGIFVETRLRQLVASGQVSARVMAPVPWFPFRRGPFGRYTRFAAAPRVDDRHGLNVSYPRYPVIPRFGMSVAPLLMARAVLPRLRREIAAGQDFDIIDAHYFYPDGVAACWLGEQLGKPVVVTARGSDLNVIPDYPSPRRQILRAARTAAGLITVSGALKQRLIDLGVAAERIRVLRNGVDATRFRPPTDRDALRDRLGLTGPVLLSVGNLVEAKGHQLIIDALEQLPECRLLIAGDGVYQPALKQRLTAAGLEERVRFLGTLPQDELRDYYGAADVLVLASYREGWANVLLEAMACGTPVIASAVGGSPELVTAPEAGRLLEALTPQAVADAIRDQLSNMPDRDATRRFAEGFSWQSTTDGQLELFRDIIARQPAR